MESLTGSVLLAALLAMTIAVVVAVVTNYYLYRWRRILTFEGKVVTIPEELIATLSTLGNQIIGVRSDVEKAASNQKKQGAQVVQNILETNKTVGQLFETAVSLQRALDQRDAEISRLKRGYDAELIRRFVVRFIRVKCALVDAETGGTTSAENVRSIGRLLDDALDECGVEEFAPKVGEDFRTAIGVADSPRVVPTTESEQNFKIVDILDPGYRFRTGSNDSIIVPARVSIYVMSSSGG